MSLNKIVSPVSGQELDITVGLGTSLKKFVKVSPTLQLTLNTLPVSICVQNPISSQQHLVPLQS